MNPDDSGAEELGMVAVSAISDVRIVDTDKREDIPSDEYYVITQTVEGHYGGVNAGVMFRFGGRHSGPFIAYKCLDPSESSCLGLSADSGSDSSCSEGSLMSKRKQSRRKDRPRDSVPITGICVRDVDEFNRHASGVVINAVSHRTAESSPADSGGSSQSGGSGTSTSMSSRWRKYTGMGGSSSGTSTKDKSSSVSTSLMKAPLPTEDCNGNEVRWELVDGNLNKGQVGHTLQLFVQRDPRADPIIDLKIVNLNKGEDVPHGYKAVPDEHGNVISLNEGSRRDVLRLCFKTRDRKHFAFKKKMFFKPKILDRYPRHDFPEFQLTDETAMFCMPRGLEIVPGQKKTVLPRHPSLKGAISDSSSIGVPSQIASNKLKKMLKIGASGSGSMSGSDPDIPVGGSDSTEDSEEIDRARSLRFQSLVSQDSLIVERALKEELDAYVIPAFVWNSTEHSFVLTRETGDRIYGACVTFYEERQRPEGLKVVPKEYSTIFVPKCICILSHYPFYYNFQVFLKCIFRIANSPANKIPIEKYLAHFIHSIPLPIAGHCGVIYKIGTCTLHFKINGQYTMEKLNFPLEILFRCLSIDDIITLIGLVLIGRRIVIVSEYYHIITPVCEAIRALMFPFQYKYTYIPVLPINLQGVLQAPVPFLVGLHRNLFDELYLPNDVVSVDLDQNMITVSEDNGMRQRPIKSIKGSLCRFCNDETHVHTNTTHRVPKKLRGMLRADLLKHVSLHVSSGRDINELLIEYGGDLPFSNCNFLRAKDESFTVLPQTESEEASAMSLSHRESETSTSEERFNESKVRVAFLQFFVNLFRTYHEFIEYRSPRTLEMFFNRERFLNENFTDSEKPFMREFMQTEAFETFLDNRMSPHLPKLPNDIVVFDYCIARTTNAAIDASESNRGSHPPATSLETASSHTTGGPPTTTGVSSTVSGASDSPIRNSGKKRKMIYKSLPDDLLEQLDEIHVRDAWTRFEHLTLKRADANPSKKELDGSPYVYERFPCMNRRLLRNYYKSERRESVGFDELTFDEIKPEASPSHGVFGGAPGQTPDTGSVSPTMKNHNRSDHEMKTTVINDDDQDEEDNDEMPILVTHVDHADDSPPPKAKKSDSQSGKHRRMSSRAKRKNKEGRSHHSIDSSMAGDVPVFPSVRFSLRHETMSKRDKFKLQDMNERYDEFLDEIVSAFNHNIDRLVRYTTVKSGKSVAADPLHTATSASDIDRRRSTTFATMHMQRGPASAGSAPGGMSAAHGRSRSDGSGSIVVGGTSMSKSSATAAVMMQSPFIYKRLKTKTMQESISNTVTRMYEVWFSIFTHHSITRLSVHTISPKRDFIQCLIVLQQLIEKGFYPTLNMFKYIALIPAHCCMNKELLLLDRWMLRLFQHSKSNVDFTVPDLTYLTNLIEATAKRSHVEFRKFRRYYTDKNMSVPFRTEFSFSDQNPIDCYPYTHALDCAPESFFDYFLSDLPTRVLFKCQCSNCRRVLSGEEIIAGFANLDEWRRTRRSLLANKLVNLYELTPKKMIELDYRLDWDALLRARQSKRQFRFEEAFDAKAVHDLLAFDAKQAQTKSSGVSEKSSGKQIRRGSAIYSSVKSGSSKHVKYGSTSQKDLDRLASEKRRNERYGTLCPFCCAENRAVIEIIGGVIPEEFESRLNSCMSLAIMETVSSHSQANKGGKQSKKPRLGATLSMTKGELSATEQSQTEDDQSLLMGKFSPGRGDTAGEEDEDRHERREDMMLDDEEGQIRDSTIRTDRHFDAFTIKFLYNRVTKLVNDSRNVFPTAKLPYRFPEMSDEFKHCKVEEEKDNDINADRSIKIIRSKDQLFWNLFTYFELFELPTHFLFGGRLEFEQLATSVGVASPGKSYRMKRRLSQAKMTRARGSTECVSEGTTAEPPMTTGRTSRQPSIGSTTSSMGPSSSLIPAVSAGIPTSTESDYLVAALPHHSWAIIHRNVAENDSFIVSAAIENGEDGGGSAHGFDGDNPMLLMPELEEEYAFLQQYRANYNRLNVLHPTLFDDLTRILSDRPPYDAVVAVLQLRLKYMSEKQAHQLAKLSSVDQSDDRSITATKSALSKFGEFSKSFTGSSEASQKLVSDTRASLGLRDRVHGSSSGAPVYSAMADPSLMEALSPEDEESLRCLLVEFSLYRLLGKLQPSFGRMSMYQFSKAFNKVLEKKLPSSFKSALHIASDKGVSSNMFASRIQDALVLIEDSYHSGIVRDLDMTLSMKAKAAVSAGGIGIKSGEMSKSGASRFVASAFGFGGSGSGSSNTASASGTSSGMMSVSEEYSDDSESKRVEELLMARQQAAQAMKHRSMADFNIEPRQFHLILSNHTFSQLWKISDASLEFVMRVVSKKQRKRRRLQNRRRLRKGSEIGGISSTSKESRRRRGGVTLGDSAGPPDADEFDTVILADHLDEHQESGDLRRDEPGTREGHESVTEDIDGEVSSKDAAASVAADGDTQSSRTVSGSGSEILSDGSMIMNDDLLFEAVPPNIDSLSALVKDEAEITEQTEDGLNEPTKRFQSIGELAEMEEPREEDDDSGDAFGDEDQDGVQLIKQGPRLTGEEADIEDDSGNEDGLPGARPPSYVPGLRDVLCNQFWFSKYRKFISQFQPKRQKYLYFLILCERFFEFRQGSHPPEKLRLPVLFDDHSKRSSLAISGSKITKALDHDDSEQLTDSKKSSKYPPPPRRLSRFEKMGVDFDVRDLDTLTQKELRCHEFAALIYFNFVDPERGTRYRISFSDPSILGNIDDALFSTVKMNAHPRRLFVDPSAKQQSVKPKRVLRSVVDPLIFDQMWMAVFRYLHQMTYESFVIFINFGKYRKR